MPKAESIAVIDCQVAGVSGDMFLGALIDLGANVERIVRAIKSLETLDAGYKDVKVEVKKVLKGGFRASKVDVTAKATGKMKGNDLIEIVEKTTKRLKLSAKAKKFASNVVHTLINTEAEIHGSDFNEVHVHEVGMVDTAAEIIGCAVALEDLGLYDAEIYATPVAVGGGAFKFSHGIVTSPAPSTLSIFQSKNFPIKGGPVESELATPTGASILVNLFDEVSAFYPPITPSKVGYGAGNKDFKEMPNILRITLGKSIESEFYEDEVAILETNIDDVSGEIVGNAVDRLLEEGAKDVSVIPMLTKKNRPGQILKVVADKKDLRRLSRVLIEETGTLGVRQYSCQRILLKREVLRVDVLIGSMQLQVKVKVSKDCNGRVVRVKPEYDDLKRVAEKTGKPLREIAEIVTSRAHEVLLKR